MLKDNPIVKEIYHQVWKEPKQVVYKNGKIINQQFKKEVTVFKPSERQDEILKQTVYDKHVGLSFTALIQIGKLKFERSLSFNLKIQKDSNITFTEDNKYSDIYEVIITKNEYAKQVLSKVTELQENFYLSEQEILANVNKLISKEYDFTHFRTQVEIDGSIIDGVAFVHTGTVSDYKIIGFEVKTDKDNYSRLYSQINSYLSIVDEVYLVINNKKIPKDLPFFVGVIKTGRDGTTVERRPINLKHTINQNEVWKTLLKSTIDNMKLKKNHKLGRLFTEVENFKRKLIWNQFVIGFKQTYTKAYLPLTSKEKKIAQMFFEGYVEDPLDDYFGKGSQIKSKGAKS